ncbi:MAG: RlmE family RNA methyltransferase [Paracoccaceae bacterium]|nr:RlmE family RNA methyltransferase [Paracoccaceae bacterium]
MRKISPSNSNKPRSKNNLSANKTLATVIDKGKKVSVKTAKGRKLSSTNWLRRQLNDPFVKLAKHEGFRSRAAFKILEINEKFSIFKFGDTVVDLGSAPGSWAQVAVDKTNADNKIMTKKAGRVLGIDLKPVSPIKGAEFHVCDFLEVDFSLRIASLLSVPADVIMSDMAANSTGHKKSDHLRIMALCEAAAYFSFDYLKPGGNFIAKVLTGGAEMNLQRTIKSKFKKVINFKPKSSRSDSSEKYVVALDFIKQ